MENKIEVTIEDGVKSLEILNGSALPRKEQLKIIINGLISSPLRFIEKRIEEIIEKQSHILVDRDKMTIELVINEKNHYKDSISGQLKINPDFEKWEINTGKSRTTHELANLIKMNRAFFENRQKAMELVSILKNFKAKVDKDIESANDDRGNIKVKLYQAVESNIPDAFKLKIPLFKGAKTNVIEVEISIEPSDLTCSLVSPDAKDFIIDERDAAIDNQLVEIKEIAKNLAIIEI